MLEHLKNETEASYLVGEATIDLVRQQSLILNRIRYVQRAIQHASGKIVFEDISDLHSLMIEPDAAHYFIGANFSVHDSSYAAVAAEIAQENLAGTLSFVASMALIYTHSYVEDFLLRLMRIVILKNPNLWLDRIGAKTVRLDAIATSSIAQVVEQKLNDCMDEIERDGLTKRISILEGINKVSHSQSPVKNFTYNRDEIIRLDELRHDFAHRRHQSYKIEDAEKDVRFLFDVAFHHFTLTVQKHGLQALARP